MTLFQLELIIYALSAIVILLAFLAYGDYMYKRGRSEK